MGEQAHGRGTLGKRVTMLRERIAATLKRGTFSTHQKKPQTHQRSSLEVGYVVLPKSLFYFKVRPENEPDSGRDHRENNIDNSQKSASPDAT